MSDGSDGSDGLIHIPKSTWNMNALTKAERVRLYDALAQSPTREEREAVLRRTIHFPHSMFSNLIKSVNDVFEKNECPPANHKNECYKDLKHVLNDFQQDSVKPVRFTLKRRSSPRAASAEAVKNQVSPQRHSPVPLHSSHYNNILQMPNWKIKGFAKLISERSTDAEKRRFIQKYLHVTDEDGNPLSPLTDLLLNDIIIDMLSYDAEGMFLFLLELKNNNPYSEQYTYYILYPFPDILHPNVSRNGRRIPNVRLLGGGKRRPTKKRTNRR